MGVAKGVLPQHGGTRNVAQAGAVHRVVERIQRVAIVQRGQRYWLSYVENGQPVRRSIADSIEDARRTAAQVNADLIQARPTPFAFQPIDPRKYLSVWLAYHEHVRRSSIGTIRRYRAALEHLMAFLEDRGICTLDRLDPGVGRAYATHLRTLQAAPNGHPKTPKRPLRDKTVRFCLEVARNFLNAAARDRHLPPYFENPFALLEPERIRIEDAKPVAALTEREEAAFWSACDPWAARIFAVLAHSGMRPGEVAALMVQDIDLKQGLLHVRGKPEFLIRTKTRHSRTLPLTPEMKAALGEGIADRKAGPVFLMPRICSGDESPQLTAGTPSQLAAKFERFMESERRLQEANGRGWGREAQFKAAQRGWKRMGGIRHQDIRRAYIRIMDRAGMPERTCVKDFRHTWATALQTARVDPFARCHMMGHTNLRQTETYTHTTMELLSEETARATVQRATALSALRKSLQT
ncbi:MAG: tyrosine-type recombinase/integrase [Planctomycetes bacterium]|nr:tyrosine-type recombinase/integrase [Planctomycetota bacterium]